MSNRDSSFFGKVGLREFNSVTVLRPSSALCLRASAEEMNTTSWSSPLVNTLCSLCSHSSCSGIKSNCSAPSLPPVCKDSSSESPIDWVRERGEGTFSSILRSSEHSLILKISAFKKHLTKIMYCGIRTLGFAPRPRTSLVVAIQREKPFCVFLVPHIHPAMWERGTLFYIRVASVRW